MSFCSSSFSRLLLLSLLTCCLLIICCSTWKYWHAPMLHAKGMAIVVAYDMYLECTEGNLESSWKIDKPVTFHRFREKLAKKMLQYSPKNRKYLGDDKFRASTQQPKERRPASAASVASSLSDSRSTEKSMTSITKDDLSAAEGRRLCGDLSAFCEHVESIQRIPNRNSKCCVVCGKDTYWVCMKCRGPDGNRGVAMHATTSEETGRSIPCMFHHHNESFFGLARNDYKLTGIKHKKDWSFPTADERRLHHHKIKRAKQEGR